MESIASQGQTKPQACAGSADETQAKRVCKAARQATGDGAANRWGAVADTGSIGWFMYPQGS